MLRRFVQIGLVVAAVAAVASVAYAAIPASNGTITGCVDSKGTLKVIDVESGATCDAGKQTLTWNQQGPVGPAGVQGLAGPQGVRGPSDGYFTKANILITPGTETTISTLDLPAGMYLVFAKVEVVGGEGVICTLSGGGNDDGVILGSGPNVFLHGGPTKPLMIPATFTRGGGAVKVVCKDDEQTRVWARISAIRVATLTES